MTGSFNCAVQDMTIQVIPVRSGSEDRLGSGGESRYSGRMGQVALTREVAVEVLGASEPEIRALGVIRLALFGSVVRNQARPDSDVDVLVEFAVGAKTYARFLALSELLEARLGRPVELVTTESLSPFIGPRILAEAQDVLRAA